MNPSFLRRFGAALVCSLIAPVAAASLASAEPAPAVAKPAETGTAEPSAKKAGADAAQPSAPGLKTALQAKEEAEREGRRHGARSKATDGSLLVWDNVNSVWVAPGRKNTYWVDDRFYAFDDGVWASSKVIGGPWELVVQTLVPEAPRGRHGAPKTAVTAELPAGVEAVYDPRLKVYRVAGRKGVFLHDARFYRWEAGLWLQSGTVDGPWETTSSVALPPTLRRSLPPPEKGTKATLPGGEVLVSEGEPNLFGVEGKPDVLYFDGTFYERRSEKWFYTASLASPWEEVPQQKVPGMVRNKYHQGSEKISNKKKPGDKKKAGAKKGGKQGQKKAAAKKGDNKKPGAKASAKKKAAEKSADEKAHAKAKKRTDDTAPEGDEVEE